MIKGAEDILKAIRNNDISRVKELLDSGVDINMLDSYLLFTVWSENKIEILKLLLQYPNINVNIFDIHYRKNETILHKACENNIEIVKLLLAHPDIYVNVQDEDGWTPLHIACQYNRIEIAKLLLSHPDIDVNIKNDNGWTPLHRACYYNYIEIVKLLLTHSDIQVDLNYKKYKNFKIKHLLKSHTKKIYKNSINNILDTMEN